MSSFPLEILSIICTSCDVSTLRNIRLASHQGCAAATPRLFEALTLYLTSDSIHKFTAVSSSPMNIHVRSLDFHGAILPSFDSLKAWRDGVRYHLDHVLEKSDLEDQTGKPYAFEVYPGFKKYLESDDDQHYIVRSWALPQRLHRRLTRFVNLKEIHIAQDLGPGWEYEQDPKAPPIWRSIHAAMGPRPKFEKFGSRMTKSRKGGAAQLRPLLSALVGTAVAITSLDINAMGSDDSIISDLDLIKRLVPYPQASYQSIGSSLKNLQILTVTLDCEEYDDMPEDGEILGLVKNIVSLIVKAKDLKKLHVSFELPRFVYEHAEDDPDYSIVCSDDLAPLLSTTWPKLQDLSLRGLTTTQDSLLQLFSNHSSSLQKFSLEDNRFQPSKLQTKPGTWTSFISSMSDAKQVHSRLQQFTLHRVKDAGFPCGITNRLDLDGTQLPPTDAINYSRLQLCTDHDRASHTFFSVTS